MQEILPEILEVIPVGPFQCNCIILGDPATKQAMVIDPGDEVGKILKHLERHDLTVRLILHTHTHIDHIGGTTGLQRQTNGRVLLHHEDLFLYEKIADQARFLRIPLVGEARPVPPDSYLTDGEEIEAGSLKGMVLHTPGHTPGSCGFYFPQLKISQAGILFPGDTLFAGSIGRTDLWKGDYQQEVGSIKKKYLPLPDEVVVVPGHGPKTTIGFEKRNNPFLV